MWFDPILDTVVAGLHVRFLKLKYGTFKNISSFIFRLFLWISKPIILFGASWNSFYIQLGPVSSYNEVLQQSEKRNIQDAELKQ